MLLWVVLGMVVGVKGDCGFLILRLVGLLLFFGFVVLFGDCRNCFAVCYSDLV